MSFGCSTFSPRCVQHQWFPQKMGTRFRLVVLVVSVKVYFWDPAWWIFHCNFKGVWIRFGRLASAKVTFDLKSLIVMNILCIFGNGSGLCIGMINSRTYTLDAYTCSKIGIVAEPEKDALIHSISWTQQKFLKSKAEEQEKIIRYRSKKHDTEVHRDSQSESTTNNQRSEIQWPQDWTQFYGQ